MFIDKQEAPDMEKTVFWFLHQEQTFKSFLILHCASGLGLLMIHVLFVSGNFFAVAKSRQGNNHSNRMRRSLLVSFWCLLLSNCLALKAAGVATPK